jgi:hypothetical protein
MHVDCPVVLDSTGIRINELNEPGTREDLTHMTCQDRQQCELLRLQLKALALDFGFVTYEVDDKWTDCYRRSLGRLESLRRLKASQNFRRGFVRGFQADCTGKIDELLFRQRWIGRLADSMRGGSDREGGFSATLILIGFKVKNLVPSTFLRA